MAFSPGAFFFFKRSSALRAGLQINNQVRRGKLLAKIIVVAVISIEFLIGQVEAGKKLVFFEDKVR